MQNEILFVKPGEPKSTTLLVSLPDGVKVRHEITNGIVVWSVVKKPVSFSQDEERAFLEKLNQISLTYSVDTNEQSDEIMQ